MYDDLYKQTLAFPRDFRRGSHSDQYIATLSFEFRVVIFRTTGSSIASRLSVITLKRRFFTSVSQRLRDKQHEIEISRYFSRPLISGIPRFTISESFRTTPRADLSPFSFISVRMPALYHDTLAFRNYLVKKFYKRRKRKDVQVSEISNSKIITIKV